MTAPCVQVGSRQAGQKPRKLKVNRQHGDDNNKRSSSSDSSNSRDSSNSDDYDDYDDKMTRRETMQHVPLNYNKLPSRAGPGACTALPSASQLD